MRNVDSELKQSQKDQAVREEALKSGRIQVERPERAGSSAQGSQKKSA